LGGGYGWKKYLKNVKLILSMDNGFNKIINNINEQRGNFGEPLIEKLGLKTGKEISLVKRSVSENSSIGVGQKIEGKLTKDVHIGSPIELGNSNTSPIKEIKEEQGKYFVKTLTSVYELFLQAQQEGQIEKSLELGKILTDIETNITEQPESLQKVWNEVKGKFVKAVEIQNKNFIFTHVSSGIRDQVLALVQDEQNPKKWKTRVFRFSGSDYQWKSYPGKRDNGDIMKGDEDNPLHHYVQSAKLHKDVYKVIDSLPVVDENIHYSEYVPKKSKDGKGGRFEKEFEFKEEYQTLKNKEWASYQDFCQRFFKGYERFVSGANHFKNFTLDGGLHKWLESLTSIAEFRNIKEELEKLNINPKYKQELEKTNLGRMDRIGDEKPELKNFLEVYKKNIGSYVEKCFKARFPETMLPDFSIGNRTDAYFKPDINTRTKKEGITVEEYKVENTEGDILVFAMAYDSKGRVYIDNIYDPRVSASDYGTVEKITQMGHLVYKPEDYASQVAYGVPEKYIKESDSDYIEINSLWENIPVIKKFKEELISRGVLKQS
jgi:hypothetical protein